MKSLLISGAIVTALAAVFATGCGVTPAQTTPSLNAKTVRSSVFTVSLERTPSYFEATGTVKASLNATLSSKVTGTVVAVDVREGDAVHRGQIVVSLDRREMAASVDVASSNLRAASVGVGNALTVAAMEKRTSASKILQAQAQVQQSQAALAAARSRLDLALAGPRSQEKTQAHLAVIQAQSSLKLATTDLNRTSNLVKEGALAARQLDLAQNTYDVAKAQYEYAVQAEQMSQEGTRSQEIRTSRDTVVQAEAALKQSEAALSQARAAALQANVREQEVESARAQVSQTEAALSSAKVALGYATVAAPFNGRVVQRHVDPGAMASPGAALITLEGGELRLEAVVPESVLVAVRPGGSVPVKIDALAGTRGITGRISEIAPLADTSTHSFLVKIVLPNSLNLRAGMFGRAQFQTGTTDQIVIPLSASWEREGLHYVFAVGADGFAHLRIVTLGATFGDRVAVLSGLGKGDRVALDRNAVADGSKIEAN